MADRIELVIFDCDDVLVDTELATMQVYLEAVRQLGCSLTEHEYKEKYLGKTSAVIRKLIKLLHGSPLPPQWIDSVEQACIKAQLTSRAVDGIVDALRRIPYPTRVASNGSRIEVARTLRAGGLMSFFDGRVFCSDDVVQPKPDSRFIPIRCRPDECYTARLHCD